MLKVDNVTVTYGSFKAVDQASLLVKPGETVGLAGTNGAGKTTLFAAVAGQIIADTGQVEFNNISIFNFPPHKRAQLGLARTFQVPREFGNLSVIENLMVAIPDTKYENMLSSWLRRNSIKKNEKEWELKANEILETLGLIHVKDTLASNLSGGQKKLLELARVLMQNPSLILLDEPFAGVNPVRIGELIEILKKLKQQGIGLLIVEHHLQALKELCTRLYVMDQGRVIAEGEPEEVLSSKLVQEAYMGGVI